MMPLPPTHTSNPSQLITRRQAASLLSIHLRTVDHLLAQGKLPFIKKSRKFVRIKMKDILAFIGE
jgi:excisionase family DNA binding protein